MLVVDVFLYKYILDSGGGSSLILGAQDITYGSNIGRAESRFSLLMAQLLGAQMRTLRTQLRCPWSLHIWLF